MTDLGTELRIIYASAKDSAIYVRRLAVFIARVAFFIAAAWFSWIFVFMKDSTPADRLGALDGALTIFMIGIGSYVAGVLLILLILVFAFLLSACMTAYYFLRDKWHSRHAK